MLNVLLFYATYGVGLFASSIRNPVYAFALYEAVYFFHPKARWWGGMVPDISYSFFVVILMIALAFVHHRHTKHNKLLKVPQFRWMYFLLILYIAAYFYAALPTLHYDAAINYLKTIIIISVAYKLCDSNTKLDYALYGYIFGAWYVSFVAFQIGRNAGDRVEGIGTVDAPDANGIAAAIAPAVVLCLYYFLSSKKWLIKTLFVIAGAFIANGLVLINSRGAFLGVIIGLTYFMIHMYASPFQREFKKKTAIFITVAGLAGIAYIVDESTLERFNSITTTEVSEEKESGGTRTFFWIAAWDMAKDHPFGAGTRGFDFYAPFYLSENINTGRSRNRSVHSSWFEALSEVGYLGLFAFIMMICSAFHTLGLCKKELRRNNQADEYFKVVAIGGALLAFIIAMSFLNRMRAEILYWCILYTACAYNIYILTPPSPQKSRKLGRCF